MLKISKEQFDYIAQALYLRPFYDAEEATEIVRNKLDIDDSDLILWKDVPDAVIQYMKKSSRHIDKIRSEKVKDKKKLEQERGKISYTKKVLFETNFESVDKAVEIVMDTLDKEDTDIILWKEVPKCVDEVLRLIDEEEIFVPYSVFSIPRGVKTLIKKFDDGTLTKTELYMKTWNYINGLKENIREQRYGKFPQNFSELAYAIDLCMIEKNLKEKKRAEKSQKKKKER